MPEKKYSISFYILSVILIIVLNLSGMAVSSKFREIPLRNPHSSVVKHLPSFPAMREQTPASTAGAYPILLILPIIFLFGIILDIRFLIKCCKRRSLGIERKSSLAELGLSTFLQAGCVVLLFYSFTAFFQSLVFSGLSSMPLLWFLIVNAFFQVSAILILYEFGFREILSQRKEMINPVRESGPFTQLERSFLTKLFLNGNNRQLELMSFSNGVKNILSKLKKSFLPSLKIYSGILPLFSLSVFLTLFLSKMWGISVKPQMAVSLMLKERNPQIITLLAIEIVILAPLAEEMFFRGFLYRFLRGRFSFILSAVVSSAVFSLLHYNISSLLGILILGLCFAYIYEKKQSLVYPVILHFLHNLLTLAFIFWIKAQLS